MRMVARDVLAARSFASIANLTIAILTGPVAKAT